MIHDSWFRMLAKNESHPLIQTCSPWGPMRKQLISGNWVWWVHRLDPQGFVLLRGDPQQTPFQNPIFPPPPENKHGWLENQNDSIGDTSSFMVVFPVSCYFSMVYMPCFGWLFMSHVGMFLPLRIIFPQDNFGGQSLISNGESYLEPGEQWSVIWTTKKIVWVEMLDHDETCIIWADVGISMMLMIELLGFVVFGHASLQTCFRVRCQFNSKHSSWYYMSELFWNWQTSL